MTTHHINFSYHYATHKEDTVVEVLLIKILWRYCRWSYHGWSYRGEGVIDGVIVGGDMVDEVFDVLEVFGVAIWRSCTNIAYLQAGEVVMYEEDSNEILCSCIRFSYNINICHSQYWSLLYSPYFASHSSSYCITLIFLYCMQSLHYWIFLCIKSSL